MIGLANKNTLTRTYTRTLKPKEETFSTGELPVEFEGACRLCLDKTELMWEIFNNDSIIPIVVKIRSLIPLEINEDDQLPSVICEQCLNQLNDAYNFKKRCLASDVKLRQYLCKWPSKHSTSQSTDSIRRGGHFLAEEIIIPDVLRDECTIGWDDQVPLAAAITYKSKYCEFDKNNSGITTVKVLEVEDKSSTNKEQLKKTCGEDNDKLPEDVLDSNPDLILECTEDPNCCDTPHCSGAVTVEIVEVEDRSSTNKDELQKYCKEGNDELPEDVLESDPDLILESIEQRNSCGTANSRKAAESIHKQQNTEHQSADPEDIPLARRLTMEHLVSRQRRRGRPKNNDVECPNCKKIVPTVSEYREHRKQCMIKLTCDVCPKSFHSRSLLIRHMRVHTGERPFVCKICNSAYSQKEILLRHNAQVHSKSKPYKCVVCEKHFGLPLILSTHLKNCHSGDHMFKCQKCPKVFRHASGLSRHQNSHTGTQFSCNICHKKFSDTSSVRRHMKVHRLFYQTWNFKEKFSSE